MASPDEEARIQDAILLLVKNQPKKITPLFLPLGVGMQIERAIMKCAEERRWKLLVDRLKT